MSDEKPEPQEKKEEKGFFEKMGIFSKILLIIIVVSIIVLSVVMIIGGAQNVYNVIVFIIVLSMLALAAYILILLVQAQIKSRFFSPTESWRAKLINCAKTYCPDNLNELYFTGDVGKKRVLAGKITGCLGLPYYTGRVKRDKDGNVVYSEFKTQKGKRFRIPKYEKIRVDPTGEGDTFFVVKKGWFIISKEHYIRCNRDLHSTLNGDVEIYDINPQPYGWTEYPFKQLQDDITRIEKQSQIEVILESHFHQYDLISQTTEAAIWFNPAMKQAMIERKEATELE